MYPRNAASPEPIAIGPVVQISDGAVQTSGVTVRVKPIGVAEADGGGTTAYSTDGVVLYTPTQAETNYTSFVLVAKKTGCIPSSVTVVTSARSVTGEVQVGGYASGQVPLQPTVAGRTLDVSSTGEAGIDLANVGSPTTTLNLSGTTISTSQTVASVTGNVGGNVVGSVGSISGVTFPSNFGSLSITVGGGVTVATNSDKTGYALTQSFPSNFASLAITSGGAVTAGTVSDKTGYSLSVAPLTSSQTASAVWDALLSSYTVSGSFGARVTRLDSASSGNAVKVTGAGHIASDIHELQPAVINNTHFNVGAIDASAIASNAITSAKIAAGAITSATFAADSITSTALATDAATEIANAVAATQALSRLDSMIESNGGGQFRFDVIALENAPAGGGGGGTDWTANERTAIRSILGIPASGTTPADPSVGILDTIRDGVNSIGINVYPVTSSTPERVNGTTITVYKDEQTNVTISTTATLTGLTLRFVAEDRTGADVLVVENASFVARTSTSATLQIPSTLTDEIANYTWTLRDVTTGNSVLARGVLSVQAAASKNA